MGYLATKRCPPASPHISTCLQVVLESSEVVHEYSEVVHVDISLQTCSVFRAVYSINMGKIHTPRTFPPVEHVSRMILLIYVDIFLQICSVFRAVYSINMGKTHTPTCRTLLTDTPPHLHGHLLTHIPPAKHGFQ